MLIMEVSSSVLGDFFVHGGFSGFFYGLIGLRFWVYPQNFYFIISQGAFIVISN